MDGKYDWGDTSLPYLNIKNADVFESVGQFVGRFPDLSHLAALSLLKIRLLIDLQSLQRARQEIGQKVPQEILDAVQQQVVSSIVSNSPHILERHDHTGQIEELKEQIWKCFNAVKEHNRYFWPALLNPGVHLTTRPDFYSAGTVEEMQLMLQYCYDAWAETPGAFSVIEELSK